MSRIGTVGTQYFDDAGDPLISGKLWVYETGTTTAKNTYADQELTILNTNPVILTAAGRQPNIYYDGLAKVILTDADDVQVEPKDGLGDASGGQWRQWAALPIYASGEIVIGSDIKYYKSLSDGNQGSDPVEAGSNWSEVLFIVSGYDEFFSSGTWTKKDGANFVYVEAVAGGGSGAQGNSTGGGSGGRCTRAMILASNLPSTVAVVVGAGGVLNITGASDGVDGGYSSFNLGAKGFSTKAAGGFGGGTGSNVWTHWGAFGARAVKHTTTTIQVPYHCPEVHDGGYGGWDGGDGGSTIDGGAGGGGCNTKAGGLSINGGNGGGGSTTGSAGVGSVPGGGGGAATSLGLGRAGDGGNGRVRVWQW